MKPPVTDRRIILIDDGPLRNRAAKDCGRAMEKLENAKAELRRFEQEDRPAYQRWLATTFGALLTEMRENAQVIQHQEMFIDAIEMEMFTSGHRNPNRAYAAVLKRREQPEPAQQFDEAFDERFDEEAGYDDGYSEPAGEISEKEKRKAFEKFFEETIGVNPNQFSKEEYEEFFADYEEMFGTRRKPKRSAASKPGAPPEPMRQESRIKEIYRILVRRLHPDMRADGDPAVSSLWHDVQQAYETRNLDRLETLLALTEIEDGSTRASLFQMRAALAELKRALRAIQQSLKLAREDFAWGFARNPYHQDLERRIRREIEEDLARQRIMLEEYQKILTDCSQPRRSAPRSRRKGARRVQAEYEPDLFGF